MSLGSQPATWAIFKAKIRERFRDSDFEHKVLSKLHQLRRTGSQQEYTTRFLHLLSQLDQTVPEFVKRWYYQQHLPEDVSSFISQHVPKTLQDVIELAHRYADSRSAKTATTGLNNRKNEAKTASTTGGQGNNTKPPATASFSGEQSRHPQTPPAECNVDIAEHLDALDRVLERCAEEELYVKLAKCTFCSAKIPCLGDFFGRNGVRMDPDKVRIICEWPVPSTKKQVQSFLGTCVYVSKFCKKFAELAAPLTDATRGKSAHKKVTFSPDQLECFHKLKSVLTSPPVPAHPDFSRDFHVRMDASDFAVGGYLFQVDSEGNEHIIAFGGRNITSAELLYPTREKELLVALHAMRTWRVYLPGRPFYINTDHKTLQSILEQKTCSQRLARWLNELGMYRPIFRWIPGDTNVIADMVSRNPSFHPAESAHFVSLRDLLRQLTATQANIDSEEVQLRYMRGGLLCFSNVSICTAKIKYLATCTSFSTAVRTQWTYRQSS
ncbi:RNase H-like domain found in reverse transcriptase [Phytophthora infestans]|uniref:RNase H-like domain found in reverse transcriptase n=1 Tax=Phytophthora infestans TaxID=4787 RepID=A0A833TML4_PHYIN|nr:RNase H-like domain found in reverse transcriptase [Phytophthora infestans]